MSQDDKTVMGLAKITEILEDLLLAELGWFGADEQQIFLDAQNRIHQQAYKIKLRKQREKIDKKLKELGEEL